MRMVIFQHSQVKFALECIYNLLLGNFLQVYLRKTYLPEVK